MFCGQCGTQTPDDSKFCRNCGQSLHSSTVSTTSTAAVATAPALEGEKTFLQTEGVTVTNSRFIVPGETYAMAGVTSVRFERISPNRTMPICLIFLGLLFALVPEAREFGFFLLVIGVPWLLLLRPQFAVALRSASGEIRAIKSKKSEFVRGIVDALNNAIVYRK